MKALLLIFLGGGAGSAFRFLISKFFYINKGGFPWATLVANFIGCLLIGFLVGWALKNDSLRSEVYLFSVIGFCGGLTTFSTFSMENMIFLRSGDYSSFISYTLLSFIGGLVFVFAGHSLFKFLA
jgi:CrcB protein